MSSWQYCHNYFVWLVPLICFDVINIMQDSNRDIRLIFIGGAPRSGTTLLQNMLDSHPDILGGPEFLHIPDIIHLRNKLHTSLSREWITLITSYEEVDTHIKSLIENFLLPFAKKHGAKILSEKTPENILVFPELTELFPDARLIQVVRDPRAIVASMLQVAARARKKGLQPAPFTKNIDAAVRRVKECFSTGFKAVDDCPGRVLTVVYEELVKHPRTETKRICNFLGIDWDAGMITPGSKKHIGEQAITIKSNELWYDAKTYNSDPFTASLEKWKTVLTPTQQVTISKAFHNNQNLSRLGYDFSTRSINTKLWVIGSIICTLNGLINYLPRKIISALKKFKIVAN